MSHCLGSMCVEHEQVMSPDTCPECDERHGYSFVRCDERCPENDAHNRPPGPGKGGYYF